jgi:hypothetical protein
MEYYIELLEFVLNTFIIGKYKSTIIDIFNEYKPKIYNYNILKQMNIIIENIENGSKNEEKEFYILKEMLEQIVYDN